MTTRRKDSARRWGTALLVLLILPIFPASLKSFHGPMQEAAVNPYSDNEEAIREGNSIFRLNCASCHGIDARGGRGPDLRSGNFLRGDSDQALFKTISKGLPGTEMTAADLSELEVWMVIAFLRSMARNPEVAITGSSAAGEKIFFGEGLCSRCHMVRGTGGRLGPDLSRVGAMRSLSFLIESIRQPDKDVQERYETLIAVQKDGRKITGARRNEDSFSVQLMDAQEELHFLVKSQLREVLYEKKSLMPSYGESVLSETRLQDLLAYLYSLRGN